MSKKGKKQDVNDDRNDLPISICNKASKILFKKALKKYYLAQY